MRYPMTTDSRIEKIDAFGNVRTSANLYMNGPEIASFSLTAVPVIFNSLLEKSELTPDEIDFFVFHQANKHILEELRSELHIPREKFYLSSCEIGNTGSSSIPIALKTMQTEGLLKPKNKLMLLGFGTGYSIGATILKWT